MNTWFYSDTQHTYGPITTEQLIAMIQAGQLVAGHFIMANGAQEWQPLGSSPFAGYLPPVVQPVAAPAARPGPPVQRPAQPRPASAHRAPVPVKKKSPWMAIAAVLALAAAGGGYFWHQHTADSQKNLAKDKWPSIKKAAAIANSDEVLVEVILVEVLKPKALAFLPSNPAEAITPEVMAAVMKNVTTGNARLVSHLSHRKIIRRLERSITMNEQETLEILIDPPGADGQREVNISIEVRSPDNAGHKVPIKINTTLFMPLGTTRLLDSADGGEDGPTTLVFLSLH